jgi:tetratricopeptide (TPR) repeat protein
LALLGDQLRSQLLRGGAKRRKVHAVACIAGPEKGGCSQNIYWRHNTLGRQIGVAFAALQISARYLHVRRGKVKIKGIGRLSGIPVIWGVIGLLVAVAFSETVLIPAYGPTGRRSSLTAQSALTPDKMTRGRRAARRRLQAELARRAAAKEEEETQLAKIRAQKPQLYAKAISLLAAGDYEQALELFKKVSSVDPHYEDLPAKMKLAEKALQKAQAQQRAADARDAAEIRDYEASNTLIRCILTQARYGPSPSYGGGRSAATILREECRGEYFAYIDACMQTGMGQRTCVVSGMLAAQGALKQFNR